jgi:hypothetical protein
VTFSHDKSVKRQIHLEPQIYIQAGKAHVDNDNPLDKKVHMILFVIFIDKRRNKIYDISFSHFNLRIWHFQLFLYDILSGWHGQILFWQTMCVIVTMLLIFLFMLENVFFKWRYIMLEYLFVMPFVNDKLFSILTWLFSIPDILCLL